MSTAKSHLFYLSPNLPISPISKFYNVKKNVPNFQVIYWRLITRFLFIMLEDCWPPTKVRYVNYYYCHLLKLANKFSATQ